MFLIEAFNYGIHNLLPIHHKGTIFCFTSSVASHIKYKTNQKSSTFNHLLKHNITHYIIGSKITKVKLTNKYDFEMVTPFKTTPFYIQTK